MFGSRFRNELSAEDLTEFAKVPNADSDAELDPHWRELRGEPMLPPTYMPPSMAGDHSSGLRIVAIGVIAMFLAATAVGVCLTYGPSF